MSKKYYIIPFSEVVHLSTGTSILEGIGIHHSKGLNEDASNSFYFDDKEEKDPFFDE